MEEDRSSISRRPTSPVKPFADLPLTVDAGKFFTSAGAEVPQSYLDQDFNITRSLLFLVWHTPLPCGRSRQYALDSTR